jgi:hypothetical protein
MKPKVCLSFRRRSARFKCRPCGRKWNVSLEGCLFFFQTIFPIKFISLIYIMSRIYGWDS